MQFLITRFATSEDFSGSIVALQMFCQAGVGHEALGALVAREGPLPVVTQNVRQQVGLLDEPVGWLKPLLFHA